MIPSQNLKGGAISALKDVTSTPKYAIEISFPNLIWTKKVF